MARANLSLSQEISSAFISAQDDATVRGIKIHVQGEELVLGGVISRVHSVDEDFNVTLREHLVANEAVLVAFRTNDEVTPGASSRWVLLSWVPDGCKVRDKMLYSSSRDDVKRSLGIGYFTSEYFANTYEDLTWAQFLAHCSTDDSSKAMSFAEKQVIEEKSLAHGESNVIKSTAMNVLPFAMTEAARTGLQQFKDGSVNWVDLTLEAETIDCLSTTTVEAGQKLHGLISNEDARFYLFRTHDSPVQNIFVFSCAENTPVRKKMTMSSSKASVLAATAEMDINFDKTFEIRSPDEIDEGVAPAVAEGAGVVGSAAASLTHAKPARPGRGKTNKISKFKADPDTAF